MNAKLVIAIVVLSIFAVLSFRMPSCNGQPSFLENRGVPVYCSDGHIHNWIVHGMDISPTNL